MAEEDVIFAEPVQDNTPADEPLVKIGTETPLGESVPGQETVMPAVAAPVVPQKEAANTNVQTFEEYDAEQQKSLQTFEEYDAQEAHPIGTAIHDRFQTDAGWTAFNPANRKLLESMSFENIGKEATSAWEALAKTGKAMGVAYVPQEESHIDEETNKWLEDVLGAEDFRKIKFDMNTSFTDIFFDASYNVGRSMEFLAAGTAYTAAQTAAEFFVAPLRAWQAGSEVIGEEVSKTFGQALEAAPEVAMAVGLGMGHPIPAEAAKYAVPKPTLKAVAAGLFDEVPVGKKISPERMAIIDEAANASAEPLPLATPVKPIEAHVQDVLAERGLPDLLIQRNRLEGQKEIVKNAYDKMRDDRNNAAQTTSPYLELIQDNEKRLAAAVEPKTKKMLQGRIEDLTDQHKSWIEEHTKEETPIMKAASAKLLDINNQLMTMASEGHIREAYKEAQKRVPEETIVETPATAEKPEFIKATPFTPEEVEVKAKEQDVIADTNTKQAQIDEKAGRDGQFSRDKARAAATTAEKMRAAKSEEEFFKIIDEAHAADVETQKTNIIAHRTKMLTDAGMAAEHANASAALEAAHYASRSARFEGLEGTAEEMYHRDAALVKSAEMIKAEKAAEKKKAFEDRNVIYAAVRKKESAGTKKTIPAQGGLDVGRKGKKAKAGFTPIQNYLRKIGVKINEANEIVSGDSKLVASEFNNALAEHGIRNPGGEKAGEFVDHDWLSEQIANEKSGKGAMTEEQSIAEAKAKEINDIRGVLAKQGLDPAKMTDAEIEAALQKYVLEGEPKGKEEIDVHDELMDLFQSAWHGTPHKFDKFTLDHIGTGEGAQSFGWGLYFAKAKGLANYYRKKLTRRPVRVTINGKQIFAQYTDQPYKTFALNIPATMTEREIPLGEAIKFQIADIERDIKNNIEYTKKEGYEESFQKLKNDLTSGDFKIEAGETGGKLYEVDIPGDENLLDLDKTLGEQTGLAKDAVEKVKKQLEDANVLDIYEDEMNASFEEWSGKELVRKVLTKAHEDSAFPAHAKEYEAAISAPEAVSRYLHSLGLKGSKYFDAQSRGAKEGTHNYVIFDDEAIKILNTFDDSQLYQKNLGSYNPTTKLITLFKGNNASTIIHESMGHHWFDELMRDAENSNAPQQLRDDARAMMEWSGIKSREAPKSGKERTAWTKAHEKVARGAERYMMEGVAPNKELAGVFAKFKKWFEEIYQAIKLRGQITPEVRAVFDRLLSHKDSDVVITPEYGAGELIAGVHETDVRTVPPERADAARNDIEKEAELTAQKHNTEIGDGLTNADKISEIPGETEVPAEGIEGAGPAEGRQGIGEEPIAEPEGGGRTRTGGAGVRAEPADGGTAQSVGAHTILELGETEFIDKAGNIRLDNLNADGDAKQLFRDLAEKNQDFMPQRGGVISDIRRREMADSLGLKPDNFNPNVPEGVAPSVWAEAVQKVMFQALDDLTAKSKAFQEIATTENDIAFIQAKQRFLLIAKQFSTMTAEAGRTLRVFDKADIKFTKDISALLRDETGMDLFQRQRQAKMFTELETQSKKAKAIQDSEKPTYLDMVTEFRINAMLSGPITHVKNMLGNTFVALNSIVESAATTVVGTVLRSEERIAFNEAKARLFGMFQGAQDGLIVAGRLLKGEEDIIGAHTVENYAPSIPGKTGEIIRIPTKLLSAEDEIFKAVGYRQELNALAYRDATNRGLTGNAFEKRVADLVNDPTEEMMQKAKETSEYQTFTNPLGPAGRSIQNFANSHFLAKMIIPFIRTPLNIAKYAGERTPFGFLSKEIRSNLSGENGNIARDTQIARMAIGTTISLAAMKWALEGNITGGGPSDPAKKAQMMAEGWRPYSVRIGDIYYSYEWFDPMATILGVSSDMVETAQKGIKDEESYAKIAGMIVASTSKNLVSKLSLRGANELALVISDPDRYGDKYVQTMVASFVPSFVGQAARMADPVQRETRDVVDALKAKIPVLRESLKPKIDVWGNDIESQGSFGPDVISPIRMSAFTNDPVNQHLIKLGIGIGKMKKEIHGVELTDDQYDDFRRIAGRRTKIMLDKVISQPGFAQIPSVNQIKFIRSTVSAERKNASVLIMQRYPEIMIQATNNKRLELQR